MASARREKRQALRGSPKRPGQEGKTEARRYVTANSRSLTRIAGSAFGGALEAQGIPIGVVEVHLLHAVAGHEWRLYVQTFSTELLICGIDIGATEEQAGIVVSGGAGEIRVRRTLAVEFIGRVQHQLRVVEPEQSPADNDHAQNGLNLQRPQAPTLAVQPSSNWHVA